MKLKRTFSIDESLLKQLFELAKEDNRNASNYMEQIVRKHLKELNKK